MTRRTVSALLIGQDIAEDRRRYRTLITTWPTGELTGKASSYAAIIARGHTEARQFYLVRVRAIRHELAQREEVVK